MIELKNLNKIYQSKNSTHQALENINLSVNKGEIFSIIGKSGAGKSTLIRCINLLEKPSSGEVIIDGTDLAKLNASQLRNMRRKIGMIFQQFNLLQRKTCWENVALPLRLSKIQDDDIHKRVSELLELVGLQDKKNHYPSELSGGQQQRVAIARALSNDPKVLLCDEATSALDPETTQSILKLLKTINQNLNLTILLITHEMSVVKSICDRAGILDDGSIAEINSPLELILKPQSKVAKSFLSKAIKQHVPANILHHLSHQQGSGMVPLAHLAFVGETAQEPLISVLARELSIKVNILQADIEYVNKVSLGHMLVQLPADEQAFTKSLDYFKEQHVQVEVIGYVPHHIL